MNNHDNKDIEFNEGTEENNSNIKNQSDSVSMDTNSEGHINQSFVNVAYKQEKEDLNNDRVDEDAFDSTDYSESIIKRFLKHKYFFPGIIGIVICVIVISILLPRLLSKKITAELIIVDMQEKMPKIQEYTIYDEKTDPNGLLGTEYNYLSKADFIDTRVALVGDTTYTGTIEVFNNNEEAEIRMEYLNSYYDALDQYYPTETFGIFSKDFKKERQTIIINGNAILRLNSNYYDKLIDEYTEYFNEIANKYNHPQNNVHETIDYTNFKESKHKKLIEEFDKQYILYTDFLNDYIVELNQEIENLKTSLNETDYESIISDIYSLLKVPYFEEYFEYWNQSIEEISQAIENKKQEMLNNITNQLNQVYDTLDQTLYNQIKATIATLKDSYYANAKIEWNNKMVEIDAKFAQKEFDEFKASCQIISYDELARFPNTYSGQPVYLRGEVDLVKEEDWGGTILLVDVTQKNSSYSNDTYWGDTIYVSNVNIDPNNRILKDDIVIIYGIMDGLNSYTSSMTIPAVSAKYIEVER